MRRVKAIFMAICADINGDMRGDMHGATDFICRDLSLNALTGATFL